MPNIRAELKKSKWKMAKHDFYMAYHFSLRYNELKDKKKGIIGISSIHSDGMPHGNKITNPTEIQAIELSTCEKEMEIIESTVREADESLYPWLLKGVTNENISYNYLRNVMGIPCGKNTYYEKRRKYYYLLAKKIGWSNNEP